MKITKQRLAEIIKEEISKRNEQDDTPVIDEGLFDQGGMLAFMNPDNWKDPFGVQTYMKNQKGQEKDDSKAASQKEKAAAAVLKKKQWQLTKKILEKVPEDLASNARRFAKRGYDDSGMGAFGDDPEKGGIRYSAPLAIAMFTAAAGMNMVEKGSREAAYKQFLQKFKSDKEFGNKLLGIMQSTFDQLGKDVFQSLLDYGDGYGPKAKDGTLIRRESNMKINELDADAIADDIVNIKKFLGSLGTNVQAMKRAVGEIVRRMQELEREQNKNVSETE